MPCSKLLPARIGTLLFIMLICTGAGQGQDLANYVPPSPNAASLGIFGEIPVSEYSGIPEISIPLYDLKSNGLSLPLSLGYHSAGIRPSDEASWVGLNWSLNAGGVITRVKRDKDDLSTYGFYHYSSSNPPPCNIPVADREPDIFYYNIGSRSGKFIIVPSTTAPFYTIRLFKKDNIKIELISYPDIADYFNWMITTPDGTRYTLSQQESTTEVEKTDGTTNSTVSFVSSWYMRSIRSLDGTQISFDYDVNNWARVIRDYHGGVETRVVSYSPNYVGSGCCPDISIPVTQSSDNESVITTDEILLKGIHFPNGYIRFITSPRTDIQAVASFGPSRKLDKMVIYKGPDETYPELKEYDFNYDYYNTHSSYPAYISTRLRLISLTEQSGTTIKPPYLFQYNDNALVDKYLFCLFCGNGSFMGTKGLIQKITYPTGGSNIFDFEDNTYLADDGTTVAGAGARIKRITAYDPDKPVNIKRYEYTNGRLMGKIEIGHSFPSSITNYIKHCCRMDEILDAFTVNYQVTYYQDFSTLGETAEGNVLGYDIVTTYYGENGENGKTQSYFKNQAPTMHNYTDNSIRVALPVPVPEDVSNQNGMLTDLYTYANHSGNFVKIKQEHNDYTSVNTSQITAHRIYKSDCSSLSYTLTTEWVQLSNQIVYDYDQSGLNPVTNTTNYYYDNPDNIQATRVETFDSRNNTLLTTNKYAQDEAALAGGVYNTMVTENLIDPVIEKKISKNGTTLAIVKTNYRDWFGDGSVIRPETIDYSKGTNTPESRLHYYSYDNFGNSIEFSKEKDMHSCYIWGFNGIYPIAEVDNVIFKLQNEDVTQHYAAGTTLDLAPLQINELQPLSSFTLQHPQTFTYSGTLSTDGSSDFGNLYLVFTDTYGQRIYNETYSQPGTYSHSVSLPAGTYTTNLSYDGTLNTGHLTFSMTADYAGYKRHANIFHTSFEEDPAASTAASKTGLRSMPAPYTVPLPWDAGNYILSWWQRPVSGGAWIYSEQAITIGTAHIPDYQIGTGPSLLIDEVRLFPAGALMSTYTYDPLIGMTGSCSPDNKPTYYEYDPLGRLQRVRDQDNNILKEYIYQYQEPVVVPCNSTTCTGVDKKCVNGSCETGVKVYTSTIFVSDSSPDDPNYHGYYSCTFHYRWSDGIVSGNYTEHSATSCTVVVGPN